MDISEQISKKIIDVKVASISLSEDGLVLVQLKEDSEIGKADVDEIQKALAEFVPEGPIFILVNACCNTTSDDESRLYAMSTELSKRIHAQAILVDNLAIRLLGNFYSRLASKRRNIKIFNSKDLAVSWLKEKMKN